MNVARFYLLLLALFILTSVLNAKFLAKTISEINTKQGVLKLMVGAMTPYTVQQGEQENVNRWPSSKTKKAMVKRNLDDKLTVSKAEILDLPVASCPPANECI